MSESKDLDHYPKIIHQFYEAFQRRDAESMVALYHDKVVFKDPAFGTLEGESAKNMWRMLCEKATDLRIAFDEIESNSKKGSCTWKANYTFSQTNKPVKNVIRAGFEFKDGKIYRHVDEFNLHKWATQALGFKGWALGWTRFFQKKLQQQTNRLLDKFEQDNA